MEAQCLCGAITVNIHDDQLFGAQRRGHVCHCPNCRKASGSVSSNNLMIEDSKISILGEEHLTEYKDYQTTSGNPVSRYFCKTCGNPIKCKAKAYEGRTVVKLGIFDKIPRPEWESFASKRQDFERPLEGTVQYTLASFGEKTE